MKLFGTVLPVSKEMFISAMGTLEGLSVNSEHHEVESFYFSVFSEGKEVIDKQGEQLLAYQNPLQMVFQKMGTLCSLLQVTSKPSSSNNVASPFPLLPISSLLPPPSSPSSSLSSSLRSEKNLAYGSHICNGGRVRIV